MGRYEDKQGLRRLLRTEAELRPRERASLHRAARDYAGLLALTQSSGLDAAGQLAAHAEVETALRALIAIEDILEVEHSTEARPAP